MSLPRPRAQVSDFHNQAQDDDVIETQLDNTMRSVLRQIHGCEALEDQVRCRGAAGAQLCRA
jgi:hypothetical protein